MNLYSKKVWFILLLVIFGIFSCLTSVKALTIAPPLMDIEANPGSIIQGTIKLTNDTSEKAQFFSSINRFEAKGEKGEPQFITEEAERIGLINWIDITPGPVELSPGESREIPFAINVPQNAEPGGHYAAIFWSTSPPKIRGEGSTVAIKYKVGTLVLLKVSGKIVEEGRVIEFNTAGKRIFSHLPIEFFVRFQNAGTIHLIPQGEINIKNIFGRKAGKVLVNEKGGSVLPDSIRRFEAVWSKKGASMPSRKGFFSGLKNEWNNFALGRYRAELNLMYGYESSKMLSTALVFWVIPWRISIVIIVALVILILIARIAIKKYNQWIIKKYRQKERTVKR